MPYNISKKGAIGRKQFLGTLASLGAGTAFGFTGRDAGNRYDNAVFPNSDALYNGEDEMLIKGGYVLSMDEKIGDLPRGDVHIRNGSIIGVAANIELNDVKTIDGSGMIVLPGLVETHWHVWTSVLRAMSGSKPGLKYFDITSTFGKLFTSDDMYTSTRLAMNEAIYSGITFVHDWCHNVRSLDHAEASIRAIRESGVRARFSVGLPAGSDQERDQVDLDIIDSLLKRQGSGMGNDLVSTGLAWPEPGSNPVIRKREWEFARSRSLPVSVHAGRKADGKDSISKLKPFVSSDMQVIHGIRVTREELRMMAEAGTSLSISPFSELRIGYGFPPVPEMLASKVNIGLSVDTFPLSGNADMFAVMKVFLNLAAGMSEDEFITTGRRILELATIEGARSMGIDKQVGSLTPGKRADLIMVDTKMPNMVPVIDPVQSIVTAAQPANVDTVIIDGKLRKAGGKLLQSDIEEVYDRSETLVQRLKREVGW